MDATIATLGAAVAGGLLVGLVARPISWNLFAGVVGLGVTFFLMELWFAAGRATSLDQLLSIITLSALPPFQRFYGAMAIAYGAILGAAIIALRIALQPKRGAMSPNTTPHADAGDQRTAPQRPSAPAPGERER
jgi:hypothetical protein